MEGPDPIDGVERALLCALTTDPSRVPQAVAIAGPDTMHRDFHRWWYEQIVRAHGEGLDGDLVYVATALQASNGHAPNGLTLGWFVKTYTESLGRPQHIHSYARKIADASRTREIKRDLIQLGEATEDSGAESTVALLSRYTQEMRKRIATGSKLRSVSMADAMRAELPPVPWIADGWLGQGDVVIFAGEWASGKSILALDLALSVAGGFPWMGRVPINRTGSVVYLDEENNSRNIVRRLSRMARGRNLDPEIAATLPIRYLTKNAIHLGTPRGVSILRTEIEAHKPVLVVLDSLIRLHGQDENSNSDMARFFGEAIVPLAAQYEVAFVILDHMRKPNKDDDRFDAGHRIRGAGDKAGVGDGLWTLEGDRESDSRTLSCRKNRWEDSLPPAMTTRWLVSEDETAAWVEARDATLSAEAAVPAILSSHRGGLLVSEIYEELKGRGISRRSAERLLRNLTTSGAIERRREGSRRVRYWIGTLDEEAIDA